MTLIFQEKREWKRNKDGQPQTMGERASRLQTTFNIKAGGAFILLASGLTAICDGAFTNHPALYSAMSEVARDLATGNTLARITEIFGGIALAAGGTWAGVSAALGVNRLSAAKRDVTAYGKNYRPGDRGREEARLAAAAQGVSTDAAPQ